MRIVVASTYVPFLSGGGVKIIDDLTLALRRAGHEVDTVMIPLNSQWPRVAEQTAAIRLLDLTESCGNTIDRLIAVRYPSYALSHPDKVAWFLHHHRGAYDLWGTPWSDMPDTPEGREARAMMIRSDTLYLREARRVYTISRNVADRIRMFNGLDPDGVLYPPLLNDHPFRPGPFGDDFVYVSRLCPHKRQDLAVEAMRYVRSDCRLVIVGVADVPGYDGALREQARRVGVADRVAMIGWVDERRKAELLAGCRAALFLPYGEDYGYATIEALHSGKPVITCRDSGASLELIDDGLNGLVVEPEPRAVAEAMDRLHADRLAAARMGRQALRTPEALGITWDHVVERLTA